MNTQGAKLQIVKKEYRASGYTVYLLVNSILRNTLHLQMLYRQWC